MALYVDAAVIKARVPSGGIVEGSNLRRTADGDVYPRPGQELYYGGAGPGIKEEKEQAKRNADGDVYPSPGQELYYGGAGPGIKEGKE